MWFFSSCSSPSSWFSIMAGGRVTVMLSMTCCTRASAHWLSRCWARRVRASSIMWRRKAEASAKSRARARVSSSSGTVRRVMAWHFTWNTASLPASSAVYSVGKVTFTSRSCPTVMPATCSSKPGMNMPLPSSRGYCSPLPPGKATPSKKPWKSMVTSSPMAALSGCSSTRLSCKKSRMACSVSSADSSTAP